jgi:ParB family chromosome partitioning protein
MTAQLRLELVPLGKLRKNPFNPRKTFDPTEADALKLEDMARSIRKDGVLSPIIVRPLNNGFQVAAGERRRMAAELANLKTIPALVAELDDDTMRRYAIVENIHRLALTNRELEDALGQIWEQEYQRGKVPSAVKEIAEELGISRQSVDRAVAAYRGRRELPGILPEELSTRDAAHLAKLAEEAPKEAKELATARARGELETDELDQALSAVRIARPEQRRTIVQQVKHAAKTRVNAGRGVKQSLREAQRYAAEGPSKQWQLALGSDERLLNRVADLLATVEKLDITYLELFRTPQLRTRAIEVLEAVRNQIDNTLRQAYGAEKRWKKEWEEAARESREA